jgi:hypothetical protein
MKVSSSFRVACALATLTLPRLSAAFDDSSMVFSYQFGLQGAVDRFSIDQLSSTDLSNANGKPKLQVNLTKVSMYPSGLCTKSNNTSLGNRQPCQEHDLWV